MANDPAAMIQQLLGSAANSLDLNRIQGLFTPIMDLIGQNGGLQSLLSQLQAGGMSEQVQSWIGQGTNLAADPSQITAALGPDQLRAAAERAGVSAQELANGLASTLPGLVDRLSPTGQLPGASQLTDVVSKIPGGEQVAGLLSGLLGGRSTDTPPTA